MNTTTQTPSNRQKLRTEWNDAQTLGELPDVVRQMERISAPDFVADVAPSSTDADAITSRLEVLDRWLSSVGAAREALSVRLAELSEAAEEGNEILRSPRIEHATERQMQAIRERRESVTRWISAARKAKVDLDARARPYAQERHKLRERLAEVRQASRTAANVQTEVQSERKVLDDLQQQRAAIAGELADGERLQADARAAVAGEVAAAKLLEDLRSDAFMAPDAAAIAKVEEQITDADLALSVAREKAAGARAALPRIGQRIEDARERMAALDTRMGQVRASIAAKEDEAARLKARDEWNAAVDRLRQPLAALIAADPQAGDVVRRWLKGMDSSNGARDCRGLQVFSVGGFASPAWLRDE